MDTPDGKERMGGIIPTAPGIFVCLGAVSGVERFPIRAERWER